MEDEVQEGCWGKFKGTVMGREGVVVRRLKKI